MKTNNKRIDLNCSTCKKEFNVLICHRKKSKTVYCGKECANIGQRTSPRYEFTCENCFIKFIATKDHGADRRFCSRKCFTANAADLSEKECPKCGDIFKPIKSSHNADGASKYCSRKCASLGLQTGEEKSCLACGKNFYTSPSHDNACCSMKCSGVYFSGSTNQGWKGGKYVNTGTGHQFVALVRPDRVGKYIAEHRIVAMQAIGRLLEKEEFVIHINNQARDNRPENLYICKNISHFFKIRCGSLPYPKKSNLKEYV